MLKYSLSISDAAPVFHYVFTEETLQPGPFISLKCVASGNPLPQITWTLDGSLLPEDQRFRVGDYITMQGRVVSYVNITSVRVEDGGEFECHARSTVGVVSHAARLNVYGLPYIRPMKDVSAVAGESLVLRCHVAGYPIDTITWSRGAFCNCGSNFHCLCIYVNDCHIMFCFCCLLFTISVW